MTGHVTVWDVCDVTEGRASRVETAINSTRCWPLIGDDVIGLSRLVQARKFNGLEPRGKIINWKIKNNYYMVHM